MEKESLEFKFYDFPSSVIRYLHNMMTNQHGKTRAHVHTNTRTQEKIGQEARFLKGFMLFFFMCSWALVLLSSLAFANNLSISNVSLEDRDSGANTVVVQFNISWDNSWRNDINHDAVWVFIKACEDDCATAGWEHADLLRSGTNPQGTSTGTDQSPQIEIQVPTDLVGAFIRPNAAHTGTISAQNVQLTVDYSSFGAADTDLIQLKVFGIEMVYIPDGDFYIGDGDGTNESTYAFHAGTGNTAQQVTSSLSNDIRVDTNGSDDATLEAGIGIDGDGGLDLDDDGDIDDSDNALYPTGWKSFYLMKYELSQAQYKDFLNTLSQAQQDNRVAATLSDEAAGGEYVMASDGATSVTLRDTIKAGPDPADGEPYTFGNDLNDNDVFNEANDGEGIAMHYMEWPDSLAYADWAGLRPITELEFEKAARGPLSPVYGEYAWGSTDVTQAQGPIQNSGQSTEGAANSGPGLVNYYGSGTAIDGPTRVGFAATATTDRIGAGAGYYGNMNLSANLNESAVTVGNSTGRSFEGSHGDGVLTTTSSYEGNATNTDWPGIDATSARGVTSNTGSGQRGASWYDNAVYMALSERSSASDPFDSGSSYYITNRFARTESGSAWSCGDDLVVQHHSANGVAPSDRTIWYKTVRSNLSGQSACWIQQNLGATQVATAATDSTEAAAGWYFQFNRKQGYSNDGVTVSPSWTITSINEDSDWLPANDPCTLEFGEGWRLPTSTEWTNADTNGSWGNYNDTYASVLKLHAAGDLDLSDGSLGNRGSYGLYWCSTQSSSTSGYDLTIGSSFSYVGNLDDKAYGFSGRCLKD